METRKLRTVLKILVACVLFVSLFVSVCVWLEVQHKERNSYDYDTDRQALLTFFHDNRELLDEINARIPTDCHIENTGFVVSYNEQEDVVKTWYPGLSEAGLRYFKIISFPEPTLSCVDRSEGRLIAYQFFYRTNYVLVGFVYTEERPPKDDRGIYEKLEDNWYFFEWGMV